jgi:uncharacterized membrane protein HdeD (DUF308 family)
MPWHENGVTAIWGILLIVLGVLALGAPLATSVGTVMVIGWVLIFGGTAHFFDAWMASDAARFAARLCIAILYVLVGFMLLAYPVAGAVTLAFMLGLLFLVEGVVELAAYVAARHEAGSGWLLVNGLVTVLLGVMVLSRWPSSASWVIALLVGTSLLMSGTSRVMLAIYERRVRRGTFA